MGNFLGHVLPGAMLLALGLWWSWGLGGLAREGGWETDRTRVALPTSLGLGRRRLLLDPLIRLGLCALGMSVEVHSALGYPRLSAADIQHVAMYAMFALAAIADLLTHARRLPLGIDYFLAALAFLCEGLLFHFHIKHQGPFEQNVHGLLLVAVAGCFCATLLEAARPQSLTRKLHRAFWVSLQGTWFFQAAILIYNPLPGSNHPWTSGGTHMEDGMWASAIFVAHCVLVLLLQALLTAPALAAPTPPSLHSAPLHSTPLHSFSRCPDKLNQNQQEEEELLIDQSPC